jgi:protein tyrosine/serine phosphatase
VIDLQKDFAKREHARTEAQDVERAGMNFYRIPMTTRTPPTREQLQQFLSIVNDPEQQPVFVHCKGGKHRTGVMTAVKEFVYDYHDELVAGGAVAPGAVVAEASVGLR